MFKTVQLFSSCASLWHLFVYVNYLHEFYWVFPGPWESLFRDISLVSSLSALSHVRGLGDQDCVLPAYPVEVTPSWLPAGVLWDRGLGVAQPSFCTHSIMTKISYLEFI